MTPGADDPTFVETPTFDYKPFSAKQLTVIGALLTRINILDGSVRSGKTIASIIRWVLYVKNECPPGATLLMIGVTLDTLKRNVIDPLLLIVGPHFADYKEGALVLFGRVIHCVGANDVRAENRIRGMTVWGCYVDEATLIPEPVLKQSLARCSAGRGCSIWTTNPDSPFHWIHLEYLEHLAEQAGRLQYWHFTLDDNLALPPDFVADLRANYHGLFYRRFILGLWVLAEGLVYDGFDQATHGYTDDQAPQFDSHDVTIDYGTQNPFAALLVGIKGDESWYDDEYWFEGRVNQASKSDDQYRDDLANWLGRIRPKRVFLDPSAASMRVVLEQAGFRVVDANNEVLQGIRTVSNRLHRGKIHVHKTRCPNLTREYATYSWDPKAQKKGEDKPLKKHDHAMDAQRYREHSLFGNEYPQITVGRTGQRR